MSFFSSRRQSDQSNPTDHKRDSQLLSPAKSVGFETVLGSNSQMNGTLVCTTGNVRLDGHFSGILEVSGNILVGEGAKIEANIDAHNISIAGEVQGNVTGNKIQILRTGRVLGDLHAASITTDEGAFIEGKITMRVITTGDEPTDTKQEALSPSSKSEETQAAEVVVEDETLMDGNRDDLLQATVEADAIPAPEEEIEAELDELDHKPHDDG